MPRIVKKPEESQDIKPFDFFAGFKLRESRPPEEPEEDEGPEAEEAARISAKEREILEEAHRKAERILADAREQAELLREQAYQEGMETGRENGRVEAYEDHKRSYDATLHELERNAQDAIADISMEKDRVLEQYIDDLKRISLAVAEKIVQTSLRSSGDIIKRMIIAATEKLRKTQWAKIYVTKCGVGISMEVDAEFAEAMSRLSDNVKIITMDNGEPGTCIIELPDEIIDASVSTQLENIKDILNNVRV